MRDIKKIKEWKLAQDRLRKIYDVFGDVVINEISQAHFKKRDQYLKDQDRSEATINHYFTLLKSLFNFSIKNKKYSGDNPVNEVRPYTVDEKRREYSLEEIERILAAAERIEKEARWNAEFQKYIKRTILILLYTVNGRLKVSHLWS